MAAPQEILWSEVTSNHELHDYKIELIGIDYVGLKETITSFTASTATFYGDARAMIAINDAVIIRDSQSVAPDIVTTISGIAYSNGKTTISIASGTITSAYDLVITSDEPSLEVTTKDLNISYDQSGDMILAPIKSSTATWSFYNQNTGGSTIGDYWVSRYMQDPESRWVLKISRDTGAGYSLYWIGNIINDTVDWNNESDPLITIKAIDGLGRLKDLKFTDVTDGTLTGSNTLLRYINNILDYNDLEQFWGATDIYIEESIEWTETNSVMSATAGPLENTRCRTEVFRDQDRNTEIQAITCLEALEAILSLFGARIIHTDGKYKIMQFRNYDGTTYPYRAFYKASTTAPDATGTRTHEKTLSYPAGDIRPLAGAQFAHLPGLYRASSEVVKGTGNGASYAYGEANIAIGPGGSDTDSISLPLVEGGGDHVMVIAFEIKTTQMVNSPKSATLEITINLNDGTNYLTSGGVKNAPPQWAGSGTTLVQIKNDNPDPMEVYTITTPTLPGTSVTNYTLGITYSETGVATGDQWLINLVYVTFPMPDGDGNLPIYVENENAGFSEELALPPLRIVDYWDNGPNLLEVKTATGPDVWSIARTDWSGSYSANSYLSFLRVFEAMALQKRPLSVYRGQVVDAYLPIESVSYNDRRYVFNGGGIDLINDTTDGEWIEIQASYTGHSIAERDRVPDPGKEGYGSVIWRGQEKWRNEWDQYKSLAVFSADLASGTQTSISISAPGHTRIKDGDTLYLVDPQTGLNIHTVTVNGDVGSSDTSITIDSTTIPTKIPQGAYIVHKPAEVVESQIVRGEIIRAGEKVSATDVSVLNIIYGTSATPPTASNYPEGTIYIQYTA